jgi:tetratricopeptide (TPR) repeat protein
MRILISLLFLAVMARADWVDRYDQGEHLLLQGRTEDAIREFRSALAERPDHAAILDALGRAELFAGRYRAAKSYLEKASRLGGEKSASPVNLAMACMALGHHRRAEQILRQVLVTHPDNPSVLRALAQALYHQGLATQAALILEKLLLSSQALGVRADLAVLYQTLGRKDKALELLLSAVDDSEPGQVRARLLTNLGVLHWKMGSRKESEIALRLALAEAEASVGKQHPDTAWILEQYSEVIRALGRKQEARRLSARAAEIRSALSTQTNDRHFTVDWRESAR